MDWKKTEKNRKQTENNQSQIAACEQNPEANFCSNIVFSLYNWTKQFTPETIHFFARLHVSARPKPSVKFDIKNHETV